MSKKIYLYRYLLIIKKIRLNPYLSFDEIVDYIETELSILGEDREAFSKRTFQRDIADIRQMFNVDIVFDRAHKGYYIPSDSEDKTFDKMIESFDIFQSMTQTDSLKSYFHFDNNRPAGTQFLQPIINAVKNRRIIRFVYMKHWDKPSERYAMPLVLKEYKGRWYLFCIPKNEREVKTFALDRIESLFETSEKYSFPQGWNSEEYFKHCFGIYHPNAEEDTIQEVVFDTNKETANYFLSQPLHKSQKLLSQNEDIYRFSITTYLTFDLEMELLSLGNKLKIVSPPELLKRITNSIKRALEQYEKK